MSIDRVLADLPPVMLNGLAHDFQQSLDFSVKACVSIGNDALAAVRQYQPDSLVMDLSLTQRSGLFLIEKIQRHQWSTQPVVFTGVSMGEVICIIDLGVSGLVSKDKSKKVLACCIQSVYQGDKWLDRDLTMKTMSWLLEQQKKNAKASSLLTPREMMVARMVTEGWLDKKIASKPLKRLVWRA